MLVKQGESLEGGESCFRRRGPFLVHGLTTAIRGLDFNNGELCRSFEDRLKFLATEERGMLQM